MVDIIPMGPGTRSVICLASLVVVLDLSAQPMGEDPQLDREFYNYHLDQMPADYSPSEETLEKNLFFALRRIIPGDDPQDGYDYVDAMGPRDFIYQRVGLDRPFVRGIFRELPHLRRTPFMYILKTGPYLVFVSFVTDPARFILNEYQAHTVRGQQSGAPESEENTDDG